MSGQEKPNLASLVVVSVDSKPWFWKLPEALPMTKMGSVRKLSYGSETVIGDDDGFETDIAKEIEYARYLFAGDPEMELDETVTVVASGRRWRARGWRSVGLREEMERGRERLGGKKFWGRKKMTNAYR
jgi:hypothetical protein